MGTVIVYQGEAFVFEGKSSPEAVQEFCTEWFPGMETGFQVYPLRGSHMKNGLMTTDTTLNGRWGSKPTDEA